MASIDSELDRLNDRPRCNQITLELQRHWDTRGTKNNPVCTGTTPACNIRSWIRKRRVQFHSNHGHLKTIKALFSFGCPEGCGIIWCFCVFWCAYSLCLSSVRVCYMWLCMLIYIYIILLYVYLNLYMCVKLWVGIMRQSINVQFTFSRRWDSIAKQNGYCWHFAVYWI